MRSHFSTIDEVTERRTEALPNTARFHRRYFAHLYRDDETEVASGHIEVIVPLRPRAEFSLRLHVGNSASETPFDAHATIGRAGVYAGADPGRWCRPLADRLTGTDPEAPPHGRWQSRDLSLSLHHGQVWWRLWTDPDEGGRAQSRWWAWPWAGRTGYHSWAGRTGDLSVRPLDYLLGGPPRYTYTDVGEPVTVPLLPAQGYDGDGPYDVVWQLQRQRLARRRGPGKVSWMVAWECREGIPFRNHAWKGDRTYGGAVAVPDAAVSLGTWPETATSALVEDMTGERARYGYRWPGAEHYEEVDR